MPERCPSPALKMQTVERFDGSFWRQYESPESLIILTSAGRELFGQGRIGPALTAYVDEYLSEAAGKLDPRTPNRRYLADGGSAKVFTVGTHELVIKEAKPLGDQLLPALQRMDMLIGAVEQHCPRWIDIPKHYGVLISKHDPRKQFMLIEKIDCGVTVGDVLNYGKEPREEHLETHVERIFGPELSAVQAEVARRFKEMTGRLRTALMNEYLSQDEYLPDIDHNLYNIVLERLETPVAGSSLKFWVIDQ
jgi:hypothetical protein